jgi:hypothetical protein
MVMPTLKAVVPRVTKMSRRSTTLDKYVQDKAVFSRPSIAMGASGTSYSWNNALNGRRDEPQFPWRRQGSRSHSVLATRKASIRH